MIGSPRFHNFLASRVASFYDYSMSLPADPDVYGNLIGASGSMELELQLHWAAAPGMAWRSLGQQSPLTVPCHASTGASSSSSNSSAQFLSPATLCHSLPLSATHSLPLTPTASSTRLARSLEPCLFSQSVPAPILRPCSLAPMLPYSSCFPHSEINR
jgi:hypothetical protein